MWDILVDDEHRETQRGYPKIEILAKKSSIAFFGLLSSVSSAKIATDTFWIFVASKNNIRQAVLTCLGDDIHTAFSTI